MYGRQTCVASRHIWGRRSVGSIAPLLLELDRESNLRESSAESFQTQPLPGSGDGQRLGTCKHKQASNTTQGLYKSDLLRHWKKLPSGSQTVKDKRFDLTAPSGEAKSPRTKSRAVEQAPWAGDTGFRDSSLAKFGLKSGCQTRNACGPRSRSKTTFWYCID